MRVGPSVRRTALTRLLVVLVGLCPLAAYTPPGVLAELVAKKRVEVERLRTLPEAREDGPWALRLGYASTRSGYRLGRALGWRRERPAVLVDLKRASPGGRPGESEPVDPGLQVVPALDAAVRLGVSGALVCTDMASYGCSARDLVQARGWVDAAEAEAADGAGLPLVAKDLIVDPLQIARAACDGADAVLLIAAACLPDLPALLDTTTLLGLEAIVEVHTADELLVASEIGAPTILVNERDRATGELVSGQAAALAGLVPPDATCLACGGIARIDQVRRLRAAGYDGFVVGRALLADPRAAEDLMERVGGEAAYPRWAEPVRGAAGEDAHD